MKPLLLLLTVFTFSAHATYAQCYFTGAQASKCCGATVIGQCPAEGCGGDKLLNLRKNVTTKPTAAEIQDWTFQKVLYVLFTDSWTKGADRAQLTEWGEGTPIRVKAHLKTVKKYTSGKETTNCNLKKAENNDYHLVLTRLKNQTEEKSITAEITPRIRPASWSFEKLKILAQGQAYVRVTGLLMFDTEHAGESVPRRYTHWEIHPVTEFEVCTTSKAQCNAGNGWERMEDIP